MDKRLNLIVKEKGARQAEGAFKKLGSSIGQVAAIAATATASFYAIGKIVSSTTAAYAKQELAEKRLEVALGKTSKTLLAQASALQKKTSFGDEDIIQAQALIASFVKEESQIKKATKATLDLAAAKGMDLKAAADLVAKTLGSSTNAMSRYGIQVEGAVGSTQRLESLTGNIAKVFGGQAEAAMETLAGRTENLSNSWGDLLESMGAVFAKIEKNTNILGTLANWFDSIARGIDIMTGAVDVNQEWADKLAIGKKAVEDNTVAVNERLAAYEAFVEKQRESIEQEKQEAEFMERFNATLIAQSGLLREVTFATSDLASVTEQQVTAIQEVQTAANEMADDYINNVANQIISRNDFLFDSFSNTLSFALKQSGNVFSNIGKAFGNMLADMAIQIAANAAIFGFLNLVTGGGFGATQAASGRGFLSSILPFAKGGSFETNGPQLILVGDNPGGRERVDITPTSSPNINGPGMTVNITGNVLSKDFVTDEIIPQIQTAIRQAS